jgi:hypothetical protein
MAALLMVTLCAHAGSGNFALFYTDGYVDEYDSAQSRLTRRSCDGPDYSVSVALDKAAIQRLKTAIANTRFFRLPDRITMNHSMSESGLEEITVCGPCPDSTLKISSGRRSNTVKWACNCDDATDEPDEIEPLVKEIRQILYSNPAVAQLPKSSCRFY